MLRTPHERATRRGRSHTMFTLATLLCPLVLANGCTWMQGIDDSHGILFKTGIVGFSDIALEADAIPSAICSYFYWSQCKYEQLWGEVPPGTQKLSDKNIADYSRTHFDTLFGSVMLRLEHSLEGIGIHGTMSTPTVFIVNPYLGYNYAGMQAEVAYDQGQPIVFATTPVKELGGKCIVFLSEAGPWETRVFTKIG